MKCVTCTSGIDHCHGTLIVHPHGVAECTDGQCLDLNQPRHVWIIDCATLHGGCGCVEQPVSQPLRSAS